MYKGIFLIILVFHSQTIFSQIVYEGNGFNEKSLLILKTNKTFVFQTLGRGCYDLLSNFNEIEGDYLIDNANITLLPKTISNYSVDFETDSLNIKNNLILKNKKFNRKTEFTKNIGFTILKYKNQEFLMEKNGTEFRTIDSEYLELSDKINQDNIYTNYFIQGKLHKTVSKFYTKKDLISRIPSIYKPYFFEKKLEIQISSYKEEKFRDPSIIATIPDEEAMIYNYYIYLNKGSKDGIFTKIKIYPQKDLKNCSGEFEVKKIEERSTFGILHASGKCKIEGNYFSTKYLEK